MFFFSIPYPLIPRLATGQAFPCRQGKPVRTATLVNQSLNVLPDWGEGQGTMTAKMSHKLIGKMILQILFKVQRKLFLNFTFVQFSVNIGITLKILGAKAITKKNKIKLFFSRANYSKCCLIYLEFNSQSLDDNKIIRFSAIVMVKKCY